MKLNLVAHLDVVAFADREAVFDTADRLMAHLVDQGIDSPAVGVSIEGDGALVEVEYRIQARDAAEAMRRGTVDLKAALAAVGWTQSSTAPTTVPAGWAGEPVVAAA